MALNRHILKILFRISSTKATNKRIVSVGATLLSCRHMSQNNVGINGGMSAQSDLYQPGRKTLVQATTSQWKMQLSDEQYHVCREKGTETPFSGAHCSTDLPGIYNCVCCGANLFKSEDKFQSSCGWPSFNRPFMLEDENGEESTNVKEQEDTSHRMKRVEVMCKQCDAHLGHVFPDGPPPTGLRYCINSVSLKFEGKEENK